MQVVMKCGEDLYYALKRVQADLKCATWGELLQKLLEIFEEWKTVKYMEQKRQSELMEGGGEVSEQRKT